tara:strand:- start:8215 stop:9441 length:1227 start_codon:yes stop_codon:yes gene_type:complete
MNDSVPSKTDIAIIGNGLTGLCLGLILARQQPSWNVLLLNSTAVVSDQTAVDHRYVALAESSRHIFARIGLWSAIAAQAAAITGIDVSDRGHIGRCHLEAKEQGLGAYGYVISARNLANIVSAAVALLPNVETVSTDESPRLKPVANGMVLDTKAQSWRAELVLLANGEAPVQAQRLGIQFRRKDYGHYALTADMSLVEAQHGIAYERFTSTGPIALLPMLTATDGVSRASLVWTLSAEQAEPLLQASLESFIEQFYASFGRRAGVVTAVANRKIVPLARTLAAEQVRSHLALTGTAAHSLHPVAGQGFNLTLRDIAALGEVLSTADSSGAGIGSLATLQTYQRHRQADQARTVALSDYLPRVFASTNPLVSVARNAGLLSLDLSPGLRGAFARLGAGLATREARISG